MKLRYLALALPLLHGVSALAAEPAYPVKPIRVIVGFPPAGGADIFARLVGQKLTEAWGQSVVVDNRPGAGSTIGSAITASANPDGYTLMVVSASFSTSAGLYRNLKYDAIKSFAPVILMTIVPNVCVVNPSVPAHSIRDLIALAKAHPGQLNVASAGTGSITHLTGALFQMMAGIRMVHVPYKGGGPALSATVGGQVQADFESLTASLTFIKSGRLRALGVTSAHRSPLLPNVPTIAESGVPGYEATNWYAILAPAATPRHIVEKLNRQVNLIIKSPDIETAIRRQGGEPAGGTPEAFGKFLRSEIAKWKKVIKAAGLTVH